MTGRTHAAVLSILVCFAAIPARGQMTASVQPQPPTQICVNGQCPSTAPPASGGVKWNPGHYMASAGVAYGGKATAFMQGEMDDLNNRDAILGYRMFITWGALEPTQGNYDFSTIDAALARLQSAYNKPKHLVVMLWLYGRGPFAQGSNSVFPPYIQQNSMYGASPVGGSYGWWGYNSNGASTGMYVPALYYPPVMDRFIALVQALGRHLDNNPNFEALFIQEDSVVVQSARAGSIYDPHYTDDAWLGQLERLLSAATAAFPHTSVVMGNSYFQRSADSVALEQWMAANRIAAGSADTLGQSGIDSNGTGILGWGLQTYIGDPQYGGIDLRPKMTAMMDVEQPDIDGTYFNKYGGPFTPTDLIAALNQTYKASHVFWTRLTGSDVPAAAQWPALAATCAKNPLTRTAYPANYP